MPIPTIQFGSDKPLGSLTGWNYVGATPTRNKDRATAADDIGNEAVSKMYNEGIEWDISLVASSTVAPTIPPNIGAVIEDLLITRIVIGTSAEAATMTLTVHNHTVNPHSSSSGERAVAHNITLDSGFGAKDFMGGTSGPDASVKSGTITIECQHVDEQNGDGDHLCGQNYGPMLTATTEWTGVPIVEAAVGWDVTPSTAPTVNTGFKTTSVSGTKALAFTA